MILLRLVALAVIALFLMAISTSNKYQGALNGVLFVFIPYISGWILLVYCVLKIIKL